MDILRITTAGSVDDGKSTLIGRLLFETKSLKTDQLQHIEEKSKTINKGYLDFSLATDGLLTERRQGITIDVSHIYFSTPKRRYIIADSPGHVEYTRNMVTGASTADAAILLLDATKGMSEQTVRHFRITSLLGTKQLIFAINKMDLIDYKQSQFEDIKRSIINLKESNNGAKSQFHFIPISALKGDNIVTKSKNLSWYHGNSLLDLIEGLNFNDSTSSENFLKVQYVLRPNDENGSFKRGFAGLICSGEFAIGNEVEIYPGAKNAIIESIEHIGESVSHVKKYENATIYLDREIDVSRGSVIVSNLNLLKNSTKIDATLCWMERDDLKVGNKYWFQHGVTRVVCKVVSIDGKMDLTSGEMEYVDTLELNDIGKVHLQLGQSILTKPFSESKELGSFILINYLSNNTAGVGFIE